MSTHLVSAIDVRNFGANTVRVGDLNGDGAPDLLFVQTVYGTRKITCLTATTIGGEILWQHGVPSYKNGDIYSDLPVQIYDWDGDGVNEVLYVQQARYAERFPEDLGHDYEFAVMRALRYEGNATMIILDARTGQEKDRFALPAPADDSFLFADLTGCGRRQDLVIKDCHWNIWGVSHEGQVLWHWAGITGHYPAIGDVDGDGRDEVFIGFTLIDHDGTVLFQHDNQEHHQDASCVVQLSDGSWRLLFGNHGLHCLMVDGTELWHHPLAEAQHVIAGRFRADSELQFMVINRGQPRADGRRDRATLLLYDLQGRELWRRAQPEHGWAAAAEKVSWGGPGALDCLLVYSRGEYTEPSKGEVVYNYRPPDEGEAIYDGNGNIVDSLVMQYTVEPGYGQLDGYYGMAADVWGDSREEVILSGPRGACIFANARPLAIPTLYNETVYQGM